VALLLEAWAERDVLAELRRHVQVEAAQPPLQHKEAVEQRKQAQATQQAPAEQPDGGGQAAGGGAGAETGSGSGGGQRRRERKRGRAGEGGGAGLKERLAACDWPRMELCALLAAAARRVACSWGGGAAWVGGWCVG
jgi:hypothetical protein